MPYPSHNPVETLLPSPTVVSTGDTSLAVVQHIATLNSLTEVGLLQHSVGVNWRQQYADTEKTDHLDEACFGHNNAKSTRFRAFNAAALGDLTTEHLMAACREDEVVSIGSLVRLQDRERHIPMMNFHPETVDPRDFILDCLTALRKREPELVPPGVLVDSGRYFHYYGFELMEKERFHEFLSLFLMPAILVSPRYVGHSLYEQQCSLRLTSDTRHKTQIPIVDTLIA